MAIADPIGSGTSMPWSFTGSALGIEYWNTGPFALPLNPITASTAPVSNSGVACAAGEPAPIGVLLCARPSWSADASFTGSPCPATCMYIVPGSERRRWL